MGVLWIFEVISWIVEVYTSNEGLKNAFLPFDIINALQGLWIFVIFTCKPNTCRQLEGKFKKLSLFMERHQSTFHFHTQNNQIYILSFFFLDQEAMDMSPGSFWRSVVTCVKVGVFAVLLPLVHALRRLFSICGTRSLGSRQTRTRTDTITVTSGTFHKSRKLSDCSTVSTCTTTDPGSSYEMDSKPSRPTTLPM